MANETGVERELALLGELDGIAYDYDRYDYGLPIDVDGPAEEMIAKVLAYKDSCTQELRAKIALYEAKDRCQPPGFEIGDDCSAELAVKLEKAEAEVRELKATCDSDLRDWKKLAEELGCEATREAMSKCVRELKAQLEQIRQDAAGQAFERDLNL